MTLVLVIPVLLSRTSVTRVCRVRQLPRHILGSGFLRSELLVLTFSTRDLDPY
jgi:hypothetical protein